MELFEWVKEQFQDGLNCSQIVSLYFAKRYGFDEDAVVKMACGFGGGMRKGEVCGAVTGGIMVTGMRYGNCAGKNLDAKKKCYEKTVEFEEAFCKRNGSIICRELLGCDLSKPEDYKKAVEKNLFLEICPKMITSAIEILEESAPVITYNDIVHLNSQLYEKQIYYKLEYINKQKAAVLSLGSCACNGKCDSFHSYVEEYFAQKGLKVTWDNEEFTFSVSEGK